MRRTGTFTLALIAQIATLSPSAFAQFSGLNIKQYAPGQLNAKTPKTPCEALVSMLDKLTNQLGRYDRSRFQSWRASALQPSPHLPPIISCCEKRWRYECNALSSQIQEIDFSDSNGDDVPWMELTNFPYLTTLRIRNARLKEIPEAVFSLTQLEVLDLRDNDIRSIPPEKFKHLRKLQQVYLAGNRLTDFPWDDLTSAQSTLEILAFAGNSIMGIFPTVLFDFSLLRVIDFTGNHIRGSLPDRFLSLQELRKLLLAGNSLSGSIPQSLGQCILLDTIDLRSTSLCGQWPFIADDSQLLTQCRVNTVQFCAENAEESACIGRQLRPCTSDFTNSCNANGVSNSSVSSFSHASSDNLNRIAQLKVTELSTLTESAISTNSTSSSTDTYQTGMQIIAYAAGVTVSALFAVLAAVFLVMYWNIKEKNMEKMRRASAISSARFSAISSARYSAVSSGQRSGGTPGSTLVGSAKGSDVGVMYARQDSLRTVDL
ncbi:hypothetical protein BJ742DRAFT_789518 [Cladochytrium replicatum]|nr:hypothetical protein BJ742DRAFT_789518 [Cladochytrium replicatum]